MSPAENFSQFRCFLLVFNTTVVFACVTFNDSVTTISVLENVTLAKDMVPKRIFLTKGVGTWSGSPPSN